MDKIKKILSYVPLIIILCLLGLYLMYQNGYYDTLTRNKIILTNEQIEKFEQDIIDGKDVTLDSYVENSKNYSTKIGNVSLNLSNKIENALNKLIKYIFRKISSVVE